MHLCADRHIIINPTSIAHAQLDIPFGIGLADIFISAVQHGPRFILAEGRGTDGICFGTAENAAILPESVPAERRPSLLPGNAVHAFLGRILGSTG